LFLIFLFFTFFENFLNFFNFEKNIYISNLMFSTNLLPNIFLNESDINSNCGDENNKINVKDNFFKKKIINEIISFITKKYNDHTIIFRGLDNFF
jgi:hypothetical protein